MKIWNDSNKKTSVELNSKEDSECMKGNSWKYVQLYKELSELIGEEATLKIWKHYGGLNISFPKKLFSAEYVHQYIKENVGKVNPKEMAKEMELSERRIRQMIKEISAKTK